MRRGNSMAVVLVESQNSRRSGSTGRWRLSRILRTTAMAWSSKRMRNLVKEKGETRLSQDPTIPGAGVPENAAHTGMIETI